MTTRQDWRHVTSATAAVQFQHRFTLSRARAVKIDEMWGQEKIRRNSTSCKVVSGSTSQRMRMRVTHRRSCPSTGCGRWECVWWACGRCNPTDADLGSTSNCRTESARPETIHICNFWKKSTHEFKSQISSKHFLLQSSKNFHTRFLLKRRVTLQASLSVLFLVTIKLSFDK